MTFVAILGIAVGAVVIAFVGWLVVGWVLVTYGLMALYLAHQLGIAPCLDDPAGTSPSWHARDRDAEIYGKAVDQASELPAEYQLREWAN
jgi:hypothetical protein